MIKETCIKCGNEVIKDKKLENNVWNCPSCGLEDYQSRHISKEEANKESNTFHYINSIKQEDLQFLIVGLQEDDKMGEYIWIKATEQITNTDVAIVVPSMRKHTMAQTRGLLIDKYNKIHAKNNSRLPEVGEIL